MKNKRLYLLPVILFSLIVIFRIVALVYTFQMVKELTDASNAPAIRKSILNFWTFFWPCLLIAEIVIYYIIRKRIYNRQWVFIHSLCNLIIFVVLPLLAPLFIVLFFGETSRDEYEGFLNKLARIRFWLFYLFLLVGHIFFILTIVKAFKKKDEFDEPAGLFDEFVK